MKILYSGEKSSRNGVGVILSPEFKGKVVEMSRPSDRLIKLKLVIAGEIFNIVSAYSPQSGDKVEVEYQLESDTSAEESWKLFTKVDHEGSRRDMWSHQRWETPVEGDLVVE